MKNKFFKAVISFVAAVLFLFEPAFAAQDGAAKEQALIDGVIAYKLSATGSDSVQQYIDNVLAKTPGSDEWYALAFCQYGNYDFSGYRNALERYLAETEISSASSREKYAIVLIGVGSDSSYIGNTVADAVGTQGITSWIFGLHLLNNGYESAEYSASEVKETILSLQHPDGGWSIMGSYGDVDITAMAIQCLAPFYGADPKTRSAVDTALDFLSAKQNQDGDFASYGVENAESAAQVLVALSSLGIDCKTDERFIKNGKNLIDVLENYRLDDGSFCHKQGEERSGIATVQVFYSLVSYMRMSAGKSGLYIFEKTDPVPEIPESSQPSDDASQTSESSQPNGDASQTSESSQPSDDLPQTPPARSYKFYAITIVFAAFAVVCVVLLLKKNKNVKNYLLTFFIALGLIVAVLLTNVQSPESYYNSHTSKTDVIGTVTISIRCDTIKDKSAAHIPDDGVILDSVSIGFEKDDTVYDVLVYAAAQNKIHLETVGPAEAVYVKGIGNIYEFDFGEWSGWVYYVNGRSDSIGCGKYKVTDGDNIEWFYTCNLGKDIQK
ncbi:MAG: DUF4430 domain-containing protein [Oscillospiraceae bacterium]|nr:DUF4430 domain-containing protein [Oscillospiraceae bacterium]